MKQRVAGYEGEAGGIGGCPAPAQGERSGDIDEAGTVTGPRGEVVPGVNRHGSSPSSTSTSSSAASSSGSPRSSAVNKADLAKLISLAVQTNIQVEEQRKLDVYSNEVFVNALVSNGCTV